jgi:hypothetical protein
MIRQTCLPNNVIAPLFIASNAFCGDYSAGGCWEAISTCWDSSPQLQSNHQIFYLIGIQKIWRFGKIVMEMIGIL